MSFDVSITKMGPYLLVDIGLEGEKSEKFFLRLKSHDFTRLHRQSPVSDRNQTLHGWCDLQGYQMCKVWC
jgi:hypothetical protein